MLFLLGRAAGFAGMGLSLGSSSTMLDTNFRVPPVSKSIVVYLSSTRLMVPGPKVGLLTRSLTAKVLLLLIFHLPALETRCFLRSR